MNLLRFVKDVKKDIGSFEKWYTKQHARDPDEYPDELDSDEWGEHFMQFIEDRYELDLDAEEDDDGDGTEEIFADEE